MVLSSSGLKRKSSRKRGVETAFFLEISGMLEIEIDKFEFIY